MKIYKRILIFILILFLCGLILINYISFKHIYNRPEIIKQVYNFPIVEEDKTNSVSQIREKYDISVNDKTLKELYEESNNKYETSLEHLSLYSFKTIFSAKDIEDYKCKGQNLFNTDAISSIVELERYLEQQLYYDKELDDGIGIDYVTYLDFDFKNYIITISVTQ